MLATVGAEEGEGGAIVAALAPDLFSREAEQETEGVRTFSSADLA